MSLYPNLVKQYKDEMCRKCGFAALGFEGCDKDLLPVTGEGKKCPYFTTGAPGARRPTDPYRILLGRY